MRSRSLALVLLLLPFGAQAQPVRDSVLTVSATRTVRTMPDRAMFWVVIEGTGETAAEAVSRAEGRVKSVSTAITALGSRASAEAPVPYSVGPLVNMNGFPSAGASSSSQARTLVRVSATRPDQLASIIASILDAGATSVTNVQFESTAADSIRRALTAEAIAAARLDADAMARALGGRVGTLHEASLSVQPNFGFQQQFAMLNLDGRFGGGMLAPEVVVSSTVTLRFGLAR